MRALNVLLGVGVATLVASSGARADTFAALDGDVAWDDLVAGNVIVSLSDAQGSLGEVRTDDGTATFAPDHHSVHFTLAVAADRQIDGLRAHVSINTGATTSEDGFNEPGIDVEFNTAAIPVSASGTFTYDLGFGLGTLQGSAAGAFPGTDITGGTLRFQSSASSERGDFFAAIMGEVQPGGGYEFAVPASTLGVIPWQLDTSVGHFEWFFVTDAIVTQGGVVTLDVPPVFVHYFGNITWPLPLAGSAFVFGGFGPSPIRIDDETKLSGAYDLYTFPTTGTYDLYAQVYSCESPFGCSFSAAGSVLTFSFGKALPGGAGESLRIDGGVDEDYGHGSVSGTVNVPEGEIAGGLVLINSGSTRPNETSVFYTVAAPIVPDPGDPTRGTYQADVGEGQASALPYLEVVGCDDIVHARSRPSSTTWWPAPRRSRTSPSTRSTPTRRARSPVASTSPGSRAMPSATPRSFAPTRTSAPSSTAPAGSSRRPSPARARATTRCPT
jgi:hypothetical protein